jgi:hypothetical protein
MNVRKSVPKPGQKVTIFTADEKKCRGEWTVKEVINGSVFFVEPVGVVQVGDHMYWFENKRKKP